MEEAEIEELAARIVAEAGITALAVDPFVIARKADIIVQAMPEGHQGVSGMLARAGEQFGILYPTDVANEGFQRFSIAHELGHYFLEGHAPVLRAGGVHESQAGFVSRDPFEREADLFAAALLMPKDLFSYAIDTVSRKLSGWEAIEALSDLGTTSLTATAIRYVGVTAKAVCLVGSSQGKIDFVWPSALFKRSLKRTFLQVGAPLPVQSCTASAHRSGLKSGANFLKEEVELSAWFPENVGVRAIEHVRSAGLRLLTLLICAANT